MKKIAILDDYDQSISKLPHWERLRSRFELHFFDRVATPDELASYAVIVAVRERTIFNRALLEKLPRLEHLALTGRLSGQADLVTLRERKISVSYTDGSGTAAAEQSIALLLASSKRIQLLDQGLRNGRWQNGVNGDLRGKSLGILGLGRVGTAVAQFGKIFGMKVSSWGPTPDGGRSEKLGIERIELRECLERSDYVVVGLRLSDQTRGLLGATELALLRDGAHLINAARAEIIDKNALYAELRSGRIFAGLDVFYQEPLPENDELRQFKTTVLSPHMGYVTRNVYETFFTQVAENIHNWSEQRPYRNALASESFTTNA